MRSDTYYGKKAKGYDEKRRRQQRWRLEHEAVEKMLPHGINSVMDMPCGTGRFFDLFRERGIVNILCLDASDEMLRQAEKKARIARVKASFHEADATALDAETPRSEYTICMRFLDLIDEPTLARVMGEITRVTKTGIICTIRLGDVYVPKTNTATHDRRKWNALVKRLGWKIEEVVPIFNAGWTVQRLTNVK